MFRGLLLRTCTWFSLASCGLAAEVPVGIENPLHGYYTREPSDRFSLLNRELEAGTKMLDTSGELPLLRSLLAELKIPVSSQMLVYSVTSLQKNLISPRRPRALYFNDDTYVAFVPGGRLEIISMDPVLGSIFYISDRVRPQRTPVLRRSDECNNCHSPAYLENIPALLIESVIPGYTGGGERAFRREQTGHTIPLAQRFGGWHLTGTGLSMPANQGNKLIERLNGEAIEHRLEIGDLFDTRSYLLPTSDLLPQLLQEHQVGFANIAMLAAYRTRELLQKQMGATKTAQTLQELATPIVRYLLFADEVPLPAGTVDIDGSKEYISQFAATSRNTKEGHSLKDLDLNSRLMKFRCSYMIYTPVFEGFPSALKLEVIRQLITSLGEGESAVGHIPPPERKAIREILKQTMPEFSEEFTSAS